MFSLVLASSQTYIACRSDLNSKYLRCVYTENLRRVHDDDKSVGVFSFEKKSAGVVYMEASAERVVGSARTRFILEPHDAKELLVHVRCAYNMTYWVPQEVEAGGGGGSHWIVGTTSGPDGGDLSKSSCTVFKIVVHEGDSIRLYHPGLGRYACIIADLGRPATLQLRDEGSMQTDGGRRSDTFTVNPVSPDKELPKYVIFKGDNGRYLKPAQFEHLNAPFQTKQDPRYWEQLPWYLQFGEDDRSKTSVLHTTYTNDEGYVRIRSESNNKFWRHRGDFLEAKSTEGSFNDRNTLFKVFPGKGYIVLQSVGANRFCKRLSSYGHKSDWEGFLSFFGGLITPYKESCLSACSESLLESFAHLHVEEPIYDRKIFDVDLHVDEARFYGMSILKDRVEPHPNRSDSVATIKISPQKETTREGTWETRVSMKRSEDLTEIARMGLEIPIPEVGGNITLGSEVTNHQSSESSESHSETGHVAQKEQVQVERTFNVPPKSLLKVRIMEKSFQCDIPYSYRQTDTWFNGETETTNHDDGIYTFKAIRFDVTDKIEPL